MKYAQHNLERCQDLLGKCKNDLKPAIDQAVAVKKMVMEIGNDQNLNNIMNNFKTELDDMENYIENSRNTNFNS